MTMYFPHSSPKSVFAIIFISHFILLGSAAFIPSSITDADLPMNTDEPGPIPPAYNVLDQAYLSALDRSHEPTNYSDTLLGRPRYQDSCAGSHYCTWKPWFSAKADQLSCELAYMKFDTNAYYERYASYTEGM